MFLLNLTYFSRQLNCYGVPNVAYFAAFSIDEKLIQATGTYCN